MAASKSRSRSSSSSSKSPSASSRSRGGSGSSRGGGSGSAQVTQDHDEIRRWAEARGGKPACVRGTERGNSCLLRIDFPGGAGADQLAPLEWEEFFEQFDKNGLAFLYQDKGKSRFNKFVTPETAGAKGSRKGARGNTGGSGGRGGSASTRGGGSSNKSSSRASSGSTRGGGSSSKSSSRARSGGTRGGSGGGSTRGGSGGGGRKGKAASGGTRSKRTGRRGAVIVSLLAFLTLIGAIAAIHPALVSFR